MIETLFVVCAIGLYCILYVWSRFTYDFEDDALLIRWSLLGGVPFNRTRVPYDQVEDVRPFSWGADLAGFGGIWGNLPSTRACVLIRRTGVVRHGFMRKLWLTPSDSQRFLSELAARAALVERGASVDTSVGAHAAQHGVEPDAE